MAGTSSLWPLHVALAAAINGDAALGALLGGDKVYSLVAPRGAPMNYLVLAGTAARDMPTFARAGEQGTVTIDAWTVGADQMALLTLYGEAYRVLHNVPLTLTGTARRWLLGQLSQTISMPDPSGEFLHGVWRYTFTTL